MSSKRVVPLSLKLVVCFDSLFPKQCDESRSQSHSRPWCKHPILNPTNLASLPCPHVRLPTILIVILELVKDGTCSLVASVCYLEWTASSALRRFRDILLVCILCHRVEPVIHMHPPGLAHEVLLNLPPNQIVNHWHKHC